MPTSLSFWDIQRLVTSRLIREANKLGRLDNIIGYFAKCNYESALEATKDGRSTLGRDLESLVKESKLNSVGENKGRKYIF